MLNIETGRYKMPILSVIAILSMSIVVNLPGLAISPVMGRLEQIFPHTSDLEIQLLSILPNLFIIPFVLLSGKLSVRKNKLTLSFIGLIIYLLSGIAYLFAKNMIFLIIISCLLGIGCGLVIPIAGGLLADYFFGAYRVKLLGIKSGIAVGTIVLANVFVGGTVDVNWHLPFIVYLVPIIPIALYPFLSKSYLSNHLVQNTQPVPDSVNTTQTTPLATQFTDEKKGQRMAIKLMLYYGLMTFVVLVITYYMPFRMQNANISDLLLGEVTGLYFFAMAIPGFILSSVIKMFKKHTILAGNIFLIIGLIISTLFTTALSFFVGAAFLGFGYGIIQPILYDKATNTTNNDKQSTQRFAILLAGNYIAIAIGPFIFKIIEAIIHEHSLLVPYFVSIMVMVGIILLNIIFHDSFVFSTKEYLKTTKT